jgi:hypothetical protein
MSLPFNTGRYTVSFAGVSFKLRTVQYCLINTVSLSINSIPPSCLFLSAQDVILSPLPVSLLNLGRYSTVSSYCISIYQLNTFLMFLPFNTGRYTVSFTCVSFKPRTVHALSHFTCISIYLNSLPCLP